MYSSIILSIYRPFSFSHFFVLIFFMSLFVLYTLKIGTNPETRKSNLRIQLRDWNSKFLRERIFFFTIFLQISTAFPHFKMSRPENLVDRMKLLLTTCDGADVHFLVGAAEAKELLAAHKLILMAASDVFEAMFRFDALNAKNGEDSSDLSNPIVVTDIEAGSFKAMLSFIYADDLSGVNADNAMEVLYAAIKYNITGLVTAIANCDVSKLGNIFFAFIQARFLGEEEFALRCLCYIDRNANTLIQSKQILQLSKFLLYEILSRDQLEIKDEITIWHAAIRWADEQSRQNGMECSPENRRAMLGMALGKIRYSLISEKDFSQFIVPSGVLTQEELIGVKNCYHPNRYVSRLCPVQFDTQRRAPYDDPNKSNGTLIMNIEKLSEFAQAYENRHYSDAVYIRGIAWKILAVSAESFLNVYMQCDTEQIGLKWECNFTATLRIVSQKGGKDAYVNEGKVCFNYGWRTLLAYIPFRKVMDSDNGWYDREEDSVILVVDVITSMG